MVLDLLFSVVVLDLALVLFVVGMGKRPFPAFVSGLLFVFFGLYLIQNGFAFVSGQTIATNVTYSTIFTNSSSFYANGSLQSYVYANQSIPTALAKTQTVVYSATQDITTKAIGILLSIFGAMVSFLAVMGYFRKDSQFDTG